MRVYLKSNSYQNKGVKIIENLCQQNKIELIESDNTINKLAKKDNCFAIAIIKKYTMDIFSFNLINLKNIGC